MATLRRVWNIIAAWGIPWAVMLTLAATWLNHSRIGERANAISYDYFVALDSRLALVPSQVLLVYADRGLERDPASYLELLERLNELGCLGIGVVDLDLQSWPEASRQQLLADPQIILGDVHLGASHAVPGQFASVDPVSTPDGVARSAWGRRSGASDSIEACLATSFAPIAVHIPQHFFGVRFRGGVESLPHVTSDALLRGAVTAAVVRDRIVLIGHPATAEMAGVTTPTSGYRRMTTLEFHGHALNTLLSGRPIRQLDGRASSWLFFFAAMVFIALGRRVPLDRAVILVVGAWTLQAFVVFLVLWQAQVFVPLATLVIIESLAILWIFDRRMCFAGRAWQIMRRRGFSVSPRYKSQPFLRPDVEPWTEVAALIHQLFPVNCVTVLVREGRREHLQLAVTVGCEDTRVVERRRDLRRIPYAPAIDRKVAVPIAEDRPFYERVGDDLQFIAPLFHAGCIKGFVVVEISRVALERCQSFPAQLTDACAEVAPWFARYEQIVREQKAKSRWWLRWSTSAEVETFEQLTRHFRSIERRLHQSFSVIENASIGKAVFDLSGQVLTMNASMFRMLHAHGLGSTEVRLLNVVRAFSKRDLFECRDLIRRTLMNGRRERVVATSPGESGNPLVLVIQPLSKSSQMSDACEDMDAFNAHGVQVEIFEADLLGEVHNVREHVSDQGLDAVDHLLTDILGMVQESMASPGALSDLTRHLDYARHTVHQCQSMLANSESEEPEVRLPVQVDDAIRAAVADVRPIVERHRATVSTSVPSELPDATANPHRLREAISIAVQELVEHARESSLININARCWTDEIRVSIENEGCAVALDRIAGLRTASGSRDRNPSRLARVATWLEAWGGSLEVTSALGEGAVVTLTLRRFKWRPTVEPDTMESEPGVP